MAHDRYESPFCTRYASDEMQYVFSADHKFKTWRKLWIALARAEQRQGLPITDAQIAELEAHADDINYDVAEAREKEVRHDVMSHVYAYGVQCPSAKGIIHLGATSCYVGDNTDVIVMREGLRIIRRKLLNVVSLLADFADRYKDMSALAPVSGQTYSRKVDSMVVGVLAGIAQSASKFSNDLRILQNFKEMEEPFEAHQIGSSAMPYKRNPMRSERITALARYVMTDSLNPAFTAATQWFERTLDDSANKRVAVAEAFLATDAILGIMLNVCDGLVVYPKVVRQRVMKELPFMATENIMMDAVRRGGDRQELHERLREHSMAAARHVKEEGGDNDLIERVCADSAFGLRREEVDAILDPARFTGRSAEQVEEYLRDVVNPVLEANRSLLGERAQLSV